MSFPHPAPRLYALPSGHTLACSEYGVADGAPVFFFHGWPSARVQGALLHEAAVRTGVRVIAPDRPGVGSSPPQPGRTLLDWPPLLGELAAAMGLKRYRVLGVSGGGPYALACAWALPERIRAAAVICGAPPLRTGAHHAGLNLSYRGMLAVHRRAPAVIRGFFRLLRPLAAVAPPAWLLVLLRGALVGPDVATLADTAISAMCYDGFRHAWGAYRDGVFEDAVIYSRPWGFPLEEVRVPVRLWHGREDRNFNHLLAEEMAGQLPNCAMRIVAGEGHYSLPIRRAEEILADLLSVREGPAGDRQDSASA